MSRLEQFLERPPLWAWALSWAATLTPIAACAAISAGVITTHRDDIIWHGRAHFLRAKMCRALAARPQPSWAICGARADDGTADLLAPGPGGPA